MSDPTITVSEDGPYLVDAGIGLARKTTVVSDDGAPLVWRTGEERTKDGDYALCRCGQSSDKPFCDGTHTEVGFDGTETAPTGSRAERADEYDGTGVVMGDDRGICSHAGFCGTGRTNAWKMVTHTEDIDTRSQLMAMVERCPSGALTYAVDDEQIEPDLPARINTIEDGPLWITGGIPVERSDGEALETRNRVVLCRCGASGNKPLCDGSHKDIDWHG